MKRSDWLNISCPVLVVLVLWVTPMLIGYRHPGLVMAYRNLFDIQDIAYMGTRYVLTSSYAYLSWPGFQILWSLPVSMGVDIEPLLPYFPVAMAILYLVPLYIFLRNVTGNSRYIWIGMILFSSANWIGQEYFCPQSMGMLLFLSAMAVASWRPATAIKKTIALLLLVIIITLTTVTHMLSALILSVALTLFCLLRSEGSRHKAIVLTVVVVTCILSLGYWNFIRDNQYVETKLESVSGTTETVEATDDGLVALDVSRTAGGDGLVTFDVDYILSSNALSSLSGSREHRTAVMIRLVYSAFLLLLGIILASLLLAKRHSRVDITIVLSAAGIAAILPLRAAGWELGQRLLMFSLPFLSYLFVSIVVLHKGNRKAIAVTVILLSLCIPAWVFSHYGNYPVDNVSNKYLDGIKMTSHIENDNGYLSIMRLTSINWDGEKIVFTDKAVPGDNYLPISDFDVTRYEFLFEEGDTVTDIREWLNSDTVHDDALCEYNLYWSNGEYDIYRGFRAKTQEEWDEHKTPCEIG